MREPINAPVAHQELACDELGDGGVDIGGRHAG
jgi:hypothetical protein